MPPPVNRNRRAGPGRPSEGAREALLAASRELFAARGYDSVSTAEVIAPNTPIDAQIVSSAPAIVRVTGAR